MPVEQTALERIGSHTSTPRMGLEQALHDLVHDASVA